MRKSIKSRSKSILNWPIIWLNPSSNNPNSLLVKSTKLTIWKITSKKLITKNWIKSQVRSRLRFWTNRSAKFALKSFCIPIISCLLITRTTYQTWEINYAKQRTRTRAKEDMLCRVATTSFIISVLRSGTQAETKLIDFVQFANSKFNRLTDVKWILKCNILKMGLCKRLKKENLMD